MRDARFALGGMIAPILLDGVPKLQETTVIGVPVLNDEARDLFRMAQCKTIADWSAVVHNVHEELCESKMLYKLLDKVGLVFEGVSELLRIRHAAESVSDVIGRNYMEVRGEFRNQVPKHVRGGRKSVQEEHHRSIGWSCFTVEDLLLIDSYGFVVDWIRLGWGWWCGRGRHSAFPVDAFGYGPCKKY